MTRVANHKKASWVVWVLGREVLGGTGGDTFLHTKGVRRPGGSISKESDAEKLKTAAFSNSRNSYSTQINCADAPANENKGISIECKRNRWTNRKAELLKKKYYLGSRTSRKVINQILINDI